MMFEFSLFRVPLHSSGLVRLSWSMTALMGYVAIGGSLPYA